MKLWRIGAEARAKLGAFVFLTLSFAGCQSRADGLLRLSHCRIVDDHGPVKAMGVNYVDGFWRFAADGERHKYLPYLDALAEAKIPFIRMGFGPWAAYNAGGPPDPQIADFVRNVPHYFERFNAFLDDLKARHIGVVLNLFWDVDPYTVYFGESRDAGTAPSSQTRAFLLKVVKDFARRYGGDPEIWLIEFTNERNLEIDFPQAPHSRDQETSLLRNFAKDLRTAGDQHLISSGNSLPRPAAEHLAEHRPWEPDTKEEFFQAADSEIISEVQVVSLHVYPETKADRPWDGGNVLTALPEIIAHDRSSCRATFIGEFGALNPGAEADYIQSATQSDAELSALWGFGRKGIDPYGFGLDDDGRLLLQLITIQNELGVLKR